ncbi:unnamed protein product, partial [marine sediment metagenome]
RQKQWNKNTLDKLKTKCDSWVDVEKVAVIALGTRQEIESGEVPDWMKDGLSKLISELQANYQDGDEIWYYYDISPMTGTSGFVLLRNGEVVFRQILTRS